jgi:hypothetical protein
MVGETAMKLITPDEDTTIVLSSICGVDVLEGDINSDEAGYWFCVVTCNGDAEFWFEFETENKARRLKSQITMQLEEA